MGIRNKLFLSVFVSLAMIVGLSVVSLLEIRRVNDHFDKMIALPIPSILRLSAMTEVFLLGIDEAHSYRLSGAVESRESYFAHMAEFDRLMGQLKQDVHYGTPNIPSEDAQLIEAISERVSHLNEAIAGDFFRYEYPDGSDRPMEDLFSRDRENVVALLRAYRGLEEEEILAAHGEVSAIVGRTLRIIAVVTILFAVTIVTINGLFVRSIVRPLRSLKEAAERLGKGDTGSRVEVDAQDELGMLARSFNLMAESVLESQEVLEMKIRERTLELEKAKSGLEETVALRTSELEKAKSELEQTVAERTAQIQEKLTELEKTNAIMVGRELKMMDMKQEIEALRTRLGEVGGVEASRL